MADTFNQHIAKLIKRLIDAGVDTLAEMEDAKQITPEEKRSLQYQFCRGMNSAHFAMAEPKMAVRTSLKLQGDACVKSTIEGNIRLAAEKVLEHMHGEDWRIRGDERFHGGCFDKLRKAVTAKPSEIERPEWSNPKE